MARGNSKQKKASKNTWKWGTREGEAENHRLSYLRLERRENAKNAAHFLPRLSPLKRFNISRAVEKELRTQNLLHSCEKFRSRLFKRKHLKGEGTKETTMPHKQICREGNSMEISEEFFGDETAKVDALRLSDKEVISSPRLVQQKSLPRSWKVCRKLSGERRELSCGSK